MTTAKNNSMTTLKKTTILLILVTFIAGGIAAYNEFFSMTKYDINEFMSEVTVSGYNGEAVAEEPYVEYSKLDSLGVEQAYYLSNVLDTVEYRITPDENLSNGDKVKVEIVYDEKLAGKYGIKLTNLTQQVEVTGAMERVSADDITPEALVSAKKIGAAVVKEAVEKDHNYQADNIKCECYGAYFLSSEDKDPETGLYDDGIAMIYTADCDTTNWLNGKALHNTEGYIALASDFADVKNAESWDISAYQFDYDVEDAIDILKTTENANGLNIVELTD